MPDHVYVALGDSISIDEYAGGAGRGGASLLAQNRDDDFPEWRGKDLSSLWPDLQYHLLAMDGGTTGTLLDVQLPRLEALGVAASVVTLTIGGNDVLSAYGDTPRAGELVTEVGVRVSEALDLLKPMLAKDAAVIVGTVYDPSDGTADASAVGLPPWPEVVNVLGRLNRTLSALAARHGTAVADIHGRFLGHGLQAGNPAQPEARPASRDLWYCDVIEPNAWGASEVRDAFWHALPAHITSASRRG